MATSRHSQPAATGSPRWHILAAVLAAALVFAKMYSKGYVQNPQTGACLEPDTNRADITNSLVRASQNGKCSDSSIQANFNELRTGDGVPSKPIRVPGKNGNPDTCIGKVPSKSGKFGTPRCGGPKKQRDINRVEYVVRRSDDDDKKDDKKPDSNETDVDVEEDYSNYPPDQLWRRIDGGCPQYPGSTIWKNDNDLCFTIDDNNEYFVETSCDPCSIKQMWTMTPDPIVVPQAPPVQPPPVQPPPVQSPVVVYPPQPPSDYCYSDADCPYPMRCCEEWDHQCWPPCSTDYDCDDSMFCAKDHCSPKDSPYYQPPQDQPSDYCSSDADCPNGLVCYEEWDHQCWPPCYSDYDCADSQFCAKDHCYPKDSPFYPGDQPNPGTEANTGFGL